MVRLGEPSGCFPAALAPDPDFIFSYTSCRLKGEMDKWFQNRNESMFFIPIDFFVTRF